MVSQGGPRRSHLALRVKSVSTPLALVSILLLSSVALANPAPARSLATAPFGGLRTPSEPSPVAPVPASLPEPGYVWTQLPAPPSAVGGAGAGMVSDLPNDLAFVFGGNNDGTLQNATWEYGLQTSLWGEEITSVAPTPRSDFGFAADSRTGDAFLFGGETDLTTQASDNATWEFNMTTGVWAPIPGPAPPPRQDAAMAIDPVASEALVVGGLNQSYGGQTIIYGDDWLLNLTTLTWTELSFSPGSAPPSLYGSSLTWDSGLDEFLLYGGCSYTCTSQIWTFDPSTQVWQKVGGTTGTPPPGRQGASWSYDPAQQTVLLFGGQDADQAFGTTYAYSPLTNSWAQENLASTPPPSRGNAASAWIDLPTNESLLMSGGMDQGTPLTTDLWELQPTSPLSVRVVASGTGSPLAQAQVAVDGQGPMSVSAQGYLNLTAITPGGTEVEASASGYYGNTTWLWVDPGIAPAPVQVDLDIIPPANLSVRVLDGATHDPLANAQVIVQPQVGGPLAGSTSASGWANFTNVPAGNATVNVTRGADYPESANLSLAPRTDVSLTVNLTSLPVLVLRVFEFNWQNATVPLAGANVTVNGTAVGLTAGGGWLNYTARHGGRIQVNATHSGDAPATGIRNLTTTGMTYLNLTLPHVPPGTWAFTVTSAATGLHLEGVTIAAADALGGASGITNVEGFLNLSLPPGNATAQVSFAGYYTQNLTAVIVSQVNRAQPVSLVPRPHLDVHVLKVLSTGSVPASGVVVDANGTVLGNVGPNGWLNETFHQGATTLSCRSTGFYAVTKSVEVNHTGTLNVTLLLEPLPLATLNVLVDGVPGGGPLPGTLVNLTEDDTGVLVDMLTGSGGLATFEIPGGNDTVAAWLQGYHPAPRQAPFYLAYGLTKTVDLDLYLLPGANVSVHLVNAHTGASIVDGKVEVGTGTTLITTSEGWTNFTDLLPGVTVFTGSAPGYQDNQTTQDLTNYEVLSDLILPLTPSTTKAPSNCTQGPNGTSGPAKNCTPTSSNGTGGLELVPPASNQLGTLLLLPIIFLLACLALLAWRRLTAAGGGGRRPLLVPGDKG